MALIPTALRTQGLSCTKCVSWGHQVGEHIGNLLELALSYRFLVLVQEDVLT